MFSIHKVSPLVRSIGTMGAIAAVTGAVTFAALTSNTVTLGPNTLTASTAALQIGTNAQAFTDGTVTGMTATLTPGVASSPFTFFLKNTGDTPLDITANAANLVGGTIPATDVSVSLECGSGAVAFALSDWAAGSAVIPGGSLGAGATWTCTETATLSASSTASGGTVPTYDFNFVGNQPALVAQP